MSSIFIPALFILLWSSGVLFVEKGLQDCGPFLFLLFRLWLAWLVVLAIFFLQRQQFPKSIKELSKIAATGVFIQGVYLIFLFAALYEGVSPGILSIILGIQPILTGLILRESMSPWQITGLILGFLGLMLTVSSAVSGTTTTLGIMCALLALLGITIGTILQKKYCTAYPLTTNLFIQYFFSATFISIIYLFTGHETVVWTWSFIVCLLWVVLVVSISASYLLYYLLKHGKATNVTSYLYCVPPITALADYLIFHNTLTPLAIFGMVLVMASLVLINHMKIKNPS